MCFSAESNTFPWIPKKKIDGVVIAEVNKLKKFGYGYWQ